MSCVGLTSKGGGAERQRVTSVTSVTSGHAAVVVTPASGAWPSAGAPGASGRRATRGGRAAPPGKAGGARPTRAVSSPRQAGPGPRRAPPNMPWTCPGRVLDVLVNGVLRAPPRATPPSRPCRDSPRRQGRPPAARRQIGRDWPRDWPRVPGKRRLQHGAGADEHSDRRPDTPQPPRVERSCAEKDEEVERVRRVKVAQRERQKQQQRQLRRVPQHGVLRHAQPGGELDTRRPRKARRHPPPDLARHAVGPRDRYRRRRPACTREAAEVRPRCGRGVAEMQPRCSRDAAEMRPRCSRGAAEVQPRCSRGAAEVQPRCS